MLDLLASYWWAALAIALAAPFFVVRFWAQRTFDSMVEDVLVEAQAGFAKGDVELHSIDAVKSVQVQGETAILYEIDATIAPSDGSVEWSGADLFIRGTDGDPNQIGEVLSIQRWNGTDFEPIKKRAPQMGPQRVLLSIRFAGTPCEVSFNFNFGNFGPPFSLPELKASA